MIIGGLQKLTLIDYPGKIACTVFLAGCSFRCPWCYNPELVLQEEIKTSTKISEQDFFQFLKERPGLIEGVVLCGGEPTIQPDLIEFCQKIKKMGFLIKLDTNGSSPEVIKELIDKNLVDYIALDIKAPPEKYIKAIGAESYFGTKGMRSNFWAEKIVNNIKKSIELLKQGQVDYEFRTTVIPVLLKKSDILKISKWICPAKKYFLQEFQPGKTLDPKFKNAKPYEQKYLMEILRSIEPFFEICQIRGFKS